jgi:peptidoglycan hydrolase-like protein with peptidoglycan-binding domain
MEAAFIDGAPYKIVGGWPEIEDTRKDTNNNTKTIGRVNDCQAKVPLQLTRRNQAMPELQFLAA